MTSPGNPHPWWSQEHADWEVAAAAPPTAYSDAGAPLPAEGGTPILSPEAGIVSAQPVPTPPPTIELPPGGPPPGVQTPTQINPMGAPYESSTEIGPGGELATPSVVSIPPNTPANQPAPPTPLFTTSGGSRGGVTAMGRLGAQELPLGFAALAAAEEEGARGREAQALGELKASDEVFGGADRGVEIHNELAQIQRLQAHALDNYRTQLETDAVEQSHEKLDPTAMFTGEHGTANRILAAIGMFLGGLASGKTGVNQFESSLNMMIDRDLMRQKSEIHARATGRKSKQDALLSDVNKYGGEEAGLLKRRADMWDTIAHAAEGYRVASNGEKLRTDAEAMRDISLKNASDNRMKLAEFLAKQTIAATGPVRKINPLAVMEWMEKNKGNPSAVAALNETAKRLKETFHLDDTTNAVMAMAHGATESDAALKERMQGEAKSKGQVSAIDQQTKDIGHMMQEKGVTDAEAIVDRMDLLLSKYPKGESIPGVGSLGPVEGVGPSKAWMVENVPGYSWFMTEEGRRVSQELMAAFNSYAKATSGQAVTAIEMPRVREAIFGHGMTPEGIRQGISDLRQFNNKQKELIYSTVSPEVAELFKTRRKIQSAVAAGTTGIDYQR